jgi:hypothetical protein
MRNIVLFILIVVAGGFVVSCEKHDTMPPYTVSTIFNATSSMSHNKDTVSSAGDVIVITAKGGIADTSRTYGISVAVKAVDSANISLIWAAEYIKSLTVTFDTVGYANSKLFRWTASISLPLPAITAKSKFKASALFTYGLNLSSQTGNPTGTDGKFVYAK